MKFGALVAATTGSLTPPAPWSSRRRGSPGGRRGETVLPGWKGPAKCKDGLFSRKARGAGKEKAVIHQHVPVGRCAWEVGTEDSKKEKQSSKVEE